MDAEEMLYEVWWAIDGCLPDSDSPAFVGTFNECEAYALEDPDGYYDFVTDHNLYNFYCTTHEPQQQENK